MFDTKRAHTLLAGQAGVKLLVPVVCAGNIDEDLKVVVVIPWDVESLVLRVLNGDCSTPTIIPIKGV